MSTAAAPATMQANGGPHPLKGIKNPHPHDVLCGRGGGTNNHIGNNHWRTLVGANKRLYISLPKRQKMLVAQSIVRAVRSQNPPGRFLQKDSDSGTWYDIGDQKAQDKTSQALREGAPELRKDLQNGQSAAAVVAAAASAGLNANHASNLGVPSGVPGFPTAAGATPYGHMQPMHNMSMGPPPPPPAPPMAASSPVMVNGQPFMYPSPQMVPSPQQMAGYPPNMMYPQAMGMAMAGQQPNFYMPHQPLPVPPHVPSQQPQAKRSSLTEEKPEAKPEGASASAPGADEKAAGEEKPQAKSEAADSAAAPSSDSPQGNDASKEQLSADAVTSESSQQQEEKPTAQAQESSGAEKTESEPAPAGDRKASTIAVSS